MKARLEMALALLIVLVAVGMILTTPGCATLAEQDQQRREIIDLRWEFENTASQFAERLDALETGRNEPAPPEYQHFSGDGR